MDQRLPLFVLVLFFFFFFFFSVALTN